MKSLLPLLVTAFLTAFISPLSAQVDTYKFTGTYYTADSVKLQCSYYVPRNYDSTKSYPFFYAWHGAGMPSRDMRTLIMNTIATSIDAIVAAPDFNNVTTGEHLNFLIDTTLNFITKTYNLDPDRSIITGYSAGGRIAFTMGLYYPQTWTGVIGFAPAFAYTDMDDTMWANIGNIRMATILGEQDFNFPYVDPFMKDVINQGGTLHYIVKPGVGHSDAYYNSQEFKDDYRECYNYILGIVSAKPLPESSSLTMDVYPQPVASSATVTYTLDAASMVSLRVYDALGRRVTNMELGYQSPGAHNAQLAALPSTLAPGVYTVELQAGARMTRKNVLYIR